MTELTQQRKEFEQHFGFSGDYSNSIVQAKWEGWQVGRSSLESENAELRSALERTLANFELLLALKPVRDASETIAEARGAIRGGTNVA